MLRKRPKCRGKVRHKTYDKAQEALANMIHTNTARVAKNKQLNVYPCLICGGWHVGSTKYTILEVANILKNNEVGSL